MTTKDQVAKALLACIEALSLRGQLVDAASAHGYVTDPDYPEAASAWERVQAILGDMGDAEEMARGALRGLV